MGTSRGGGKAPRGTRDAASGAVSGHLGEVDAFAPELHGARVDLSSFVGKHLVLAIGLSVATTMFVISGVMNFRFGATLGSGPVDPLLYGVASLTSDGFKALLPFIALGLWRARKPLLTVAALTIWCLCVAWSLASAMGFASASRDATLATRNAVDQERLALTLRAERLQDQIALLPAHRPASVVSAAIARAQVPRAVWTRTRECTDVTVPQSLLACQPVLSLRQELAVAQDAKRLERRLSETRQRLSGVAPAGNAADPQAETISSVLGVEPERIRIGLAVLIAVVIEAGSALGFALVALGAGQLQVRRLPQRLDLSGPERDMIARELMTEQLEALRVRNVKREAALAEERVVIERQLTEAMLEIEKTQALRPPPKRGAVSDISEAPEDAAPTLSEAPEDAAPALRDAVSEAVSLDAEVEADGPEPDSSEAKAKAKAKAKAEDPPVDTAGDPPVEPEATSPINGSSDGALSVEVEADLNQDLGVSSPEDENQDLAAEMRALGASIAIEPTRTAQVSDAEKRLIEEKVARDTEIEKQIGRGKTVAPPPARRNAS